MLRLILCKLGIHNTILIYSYHHDGQQETSYSYGCSRKGCRWAG